MAAANGRARARDHFRRSLLLNLNSAMALTLSGWIEVMCGNGSEDRGMVVRAQQLNPRDWLMSGVMAVADMIDENDLDAIGWAELALAQNRRFAVALRVLSVANVRLGRLERAREAVEPNLTSSGFLARIPFPLERTAKIYAEALAIAGLPP